MILVRRGSSSSAVAAVETPPAPSSPTGQGHRRGREDDEQKMLIESLPLFTHKSSLAVLPKISQDCAVCLSGFHPDDQLRLLPYCRHAFHSSCIDTWLRSSRSCPLCRTSILQEPLPPPPPAPPPLPLPAPETATTASAALATAARSDVSGSIRIDIGSLSRRMTVEGDAPPLQWRTLSYSSMGSSFERVTEEEMDAIVAAVAAESRQQNHKEEKKSLPEGTTAPREEEPAGAGGGGVSGESRNWLRDYVDRMVSSASSSFSSIRFSRRSSRRHEGDAASVGGGGDLEWSHRPQAEDEAAVGAFFSFYWWLVGT